tara:strand:- start:12437 stop:12775 length:339 start_codon:yes stop_codon:yes gene_type:complete
MRSHLRPGPNQPLYDAQLELRTILEGSGSTVVNTQFRRGDSINCFVQVDKGQLTHLAGYLTAQVETPGQQAPQIQYEGERGKYIFVETPMSQEEFEEADTQGVHPVTPTSTP